MRSTHGKPAPPVTSPIQANQQGAGPGVRARLAAGMATFPPAQTRLAAYLLSHLATASDLGINDLSEEAGVSVGTISLICRRLGLRGYQDLRLSLAREAVTLGSAQSSVVLPDTFDDANGNPVARAVQLVFGGTIESLTETGRSLDQAAVERAAQRLSDARRVEWIGVGTAGLVAAEGALKLRKLGIDAVAHGDTHQQLWSAACLGPDDVLIAVSHSGRTLDVLASATVAREAGAVVIAITGVGPSPLARLADIVLGTVSYDTAFQTEPMASTIAQVSLVQLLFLVLLERGGAVAQAVLTRTQAALESAHVKGRVR